MNDEAEIIDSSKMEALSRFPVVYENDEEITVPQNTEMLEVVIGILKADVIIGSVSRISGKVSGDLVIEKQNIRFVGDSILKLLDTEKPWDAPIEFENGKDKVLITYSSSWAHNLPAPLERINGYNRRNYVMDNLRSRDWWLSLPPNTAYRLTEEIKKLFS